MKKFKKGILSMHKSINSSKYGKVKLSKPAPDPKKKYNLYSDGWRKRV